jgi:hypothetical protein
MTAIYLTAMPVNAVGQSIFRVVPTPNDNFNNGLYAVSAYSPSDIWAVGQSTIHFDGAKWTALPAAANTSSLGGVADISPTEAWAVGSANIGQGPTGQVIERWDGTQWSVFPGPSFATGDTPNLTAMTAISADDIWAVGSLLSDGGQILNFLFEHGDGTSWAATAHVANDAFLFAVSADATNDVWAVGSADPRTTIAGLWCCTMTARIGNT